MCTPYPNYPHTNLGLTPACRDRIHLGLLSSILQSRVRVISAHVNTESLFRKHEWNISSHHLQLEDQESDGPFIWAFNPSPLLLCLPSPTLENNPPNISSPLESTEGDPESNGIPREDSWSSAGGENCTPHFFQGDESEWHGQLHKDSHHHHGPQSFPVHEKRWAGLTAEGYGSLLLRIRVEHAVQVRSEDIFCHLHQTQN